MNEAEILIILDGNKYYQRNIKLLKWSTNTMNYQLSQDFDKFFTQLEGQESLRIIYVLEQVEICGSTKILLQQANELVKRGHRVTVVCQQPFPQWMPISANYLQAPWQMDVSQAIPEADIIICSGASSVIDCYLAKKAPVIHFEQGETYIFEFDAVDAASQDLLQKAWLLPVARLAVSHGLANVIKNNFNREPKVIHNALDPQYFYPPQHKKRANVPRILLVGSEQSHFKGLPLIWAALDAVRQRGHNFDLVWVTPSQPSKEIEGKVVLKPSQKELGDIYRCSDIYICGSYYESFPLPPLEAMTCGCAVISTRNIGVLEYAVDGYNCLLTNIGDPQGIAEAVIKLLDKPEEREQLIQGGYATAQKFSWSKIISELEKYMYSQVYAWRHNREPYNLFPKSENILRIEELPRNLNPKKAHAYIEQIQNSMYEEWCLWLVEGEQIDISSIDQIKRILTEESMDTSYSLSVIYDQDLLDCQIVRWECRLIQKGRAISTLFGSGTKLPIEISGGVSSYFLPLWLGQTRKLINQGQYEEAFFSLCEEQGKSGIEKILIKKWLIILLIKLEVFKPAIALIREILHSDLFYTDVIYLFAIIGYRMYYDNSVIEQIIKKAKLIGEACLYPEYFRNMNMLDQIKLN